MKITICGSMVFENEMQAMVKKLEGLGHEAKAPIERVKDEAGKDLHVLEFHEIRHSAGKDDAWVWDRKAEAIQAHFDKVAWSDAILVLNYDKNKVANYIGGNTLMEIALAFHLKKKIYFFNDVPEVSYKEELFGVKPEIINGDLKLIV
jgi:hypothetical protein